MAYQNTNYDLSQFLDMLIFGSNGSPSPQTADPATKKLLVTLTNAYITDLVTASLTASSSVAVSGGKKRKLLSSSSISHAVCHDGSAYGRVKAVMAAKRELNEVLMTASGIGEIEEEEGDREREGEGGEEKRGGESKR